MDKKIKESGKKAMIRNKDIKEELNMINMKNAKNIIENAETRMAVHTHTHTHLSFSK